MLYSKVLACLEDAIKGITEAYQDLGTMLNPPYCLDGKYLKENVSSLCYALVEYVFREYKKDFKDSGRVISDIFSVFSYLNVEYELGAGQFNYGVVLTSANLISRYIQAVNGDWLIKLSSGIRGMMKEAVSISSNVEGLYNGTAKGMAKVTYEPGDVVNELFNYHMGICLQTGLYRVGMKYNTTYCVEEGEPEEYCLSCTNMSHQNFHMEFTKDYVKDCSGRLSEDKDYTDILRGCLVMYMSFLKEKEGVNKIYFRMGKTSGISVLLSEEGKKTSILFI